MVLHRPVEPTPFSGLGYQKRAIFPDHAQGSIQSCRAFISRLPPAWLIPTGKSALVPPRRSCIRWGPTPTHEDLIKRIEAQRNLMIAVATGGPRIQTVNTEYQEQREGLAAMLADLDIPDPNPFSDLWAWYGKWSSGDLPSYQSRRRFISELYEPLISQLKRGTPTKASGIFKEPTG